MRARRRSSGIRAALLALLCASLTAGCATLQQDGTVTEATEGDAGASQVQIWPSPPGQNELPSAIVSGFLEAARSGASNREIAADYLTADVKKQWQQDQNTVIVLADYSEGSPQAVDGSGAQGPQNAVGDSDPESPKVVEQVQGTLLGQLDANGLYSAQSGSGSYSFTVEKTQDGWRISNLPSGFGALMERSDFESFYARHTVYYENPQAEQGGLIPAQVYLPSVESDDQVAGQLAKLVVDGVPDQLASAMQNSVNGVTYQGLQMGDNGLATVTVESGGRCAEHDQCSGLAVQLAQTLVRLSSKITAVQVKDAATGDLSEQSGPRNELVDYGPTPQLGGPGVSSFYAISLTGQLEELEMSGAVADADVLKGSKLTFSSVAASTSAGGDVRRLALVSKDHATISVAQQRGGVWQPTTVYPAAGSAVGGSVGRAGWDSAGDLWFTVTLNGITSVYRYGGGSLDQVTVAGLGGATIDEVLPAPDNDRVAVRVTTAAGVQSIVLGAVSETDGSYGLDLAGAQYAAYGWNSITDFDWYDEQSLAVLGTQPGSQSLGLYEIYTDGSAAFDSLTSQPIQASPPGQAGSFVWTVAGHPIASSPSQGKDTLYTLSVEGQDAQPMGLTGTSPTY